MNFIHDLCKIAKQSLDYYGVNICTAKTNRDFIQMWMNVRLKLIPQQKYQVFRSNTLTSRHLTQEISHGIDFVQEKLEQGDDVTPHMSKSLFNGNFTDYLLSDWGIYHLHLGLSMDGDFIKRTKEVLFFIVHENRAYFIDVRDHGKNGEKHVFAQLDLLQTLADEFPEVIQRFEFRGFADISPIITDPAEIIKYRKAGVEIYHKINDKIYAPMGGGITTDCTSTRAQIETDRLLYFVDNWEKYVNESRDEVDNIFSQASDYQADKADFRLCQDDNGFLVVDKHSGAAMRLSYSSPDKITVCQ